jgi:cholesterol transport system auxiliary component
VNEGVKNLSHHFGVWILLMLSGCSVISAADSNIPRTYLLDIPLPTLSPPPPHGKTLLVAVPQAAAGFDTPRLAYVRTPYVLEYYTQSQWVDTPARMLLPLLVTHLEASGLFGAVLSAATSPVVGEWRLDTEIVRFQQEFLTEPSQIHLILRIQLLDMVARQVVATGILEIKENSPSEDAEGGVLAANQVVAQALNGVVAFLKKQMPQP